MKSWINSRKLKDDMVEEYSSVLSSSLKTTGGYSKFRVMFETSPLLSNYSLMLPEEEFNKIETSMHGANTNEMYTMLKNWFGCVM